MKIDVHVHLLGVKAEHGCYVAPKLSRGPAFAVLSRVLGLPAAAPERLDEAYAEHLVKLAQESELDGIGVLAFDGVYDAQGKLDRAMTSVMVGNDYCLSVCAASDKLLPICSVNPQRADAIAELERVVAAGAVAIKTLPNSQGFDPQHEGYRPFWRRMAQLRIPLLTHTSFEHTIPPINQLYGKPERLKPALEEGVKVIAAHCAGSGVAHPFREDFGTWLAMLSEYEHLYGDVSAMASVSRFPYIHKVLASPLARERVLFGSDFPIPVSPAVFLPQLGVSGVRRLRAIKNPLQRNLEVMRSLGLGEDVIERGAKVLRL